MYNFLIIVCVCKPNIFSCFVCREEKSPSLANTQLSVCTGGTTAVENGIPSSESSFTAPGVRGSLVSRAVEGRISNSFLYDYAWNPEGSEFLLL